MDTIAILIVAGVALYLVSRGQAFGNILQPAGGDGSAGGRPGAGGAVQSVALAIANAEGFNVSGSVAQRNNNPGNIGGAAASYATLGDGWQALYSQIASIFNNTSGFYNSGMTISQVGLIYAGGDPNWSKNVAAYLGVPESTTFDQLAAML